MYKEILSSIKGISIFPVFSFAVFFVFFSLIIFWMIKSKKNDFEDISRTPLSENDEQ
jgi:cbb3-type cytochrome oxidase subunit 3